LKREAKLRLGLVGLGTAGRSVAEAAHKLPGWSFVAGADLRSEARDRYQTQYGIRVFESASQLCAWQGVDVVYVATPNFLHAEHAVTALESRKHVIVEKPMALTLEQCDAMIAAAEKNRVMLMVAHTRSFNPPIRKMREVIASNRLGRVVQINTPLFPLAGAATAPGGSGHEAGRRSLLPAGAPSGRYRAAPRRGPGEKRAGRRRRLGPQKRD